MAKTGVSTDVSTALKPDLSDVDIVHLFNLDRPLETYAQMRHAKRQGRRVVLSSIHRPFRHVEYYERHCRTGLLALWGKLAPSHSSREIAKDLYRALNRQAPLAAWLQEARLGQKRQQEAILEQTDAFCLLAEMEAEEIERDFGRRPKSSIVVRNGYSGDELEAASLDDATERALEGLPSFLLSAGRIEAGKNQIGIADALRGTDVPVVFVGGVNPWHKGYVRKFKKAVASSPNLRYLGKVPPNQMPTLYSRAKVHLLASWFEASPLVDLEAAYWGCNVVTTMRSYALEYARPFALFCDPADPASIRETALAAMAAPPNEAGRRIVEKDFTWEAAGLALKGLYERLAGQ